MALLSPNFAIKSSDSLRLIVKHHIHWSNVDIMRISAFILLALMPVGAAQAGNSYVLPDGVNRAPAVTLHCASDSSHAAACGTAQAPLVVVSPTSPSVQANQVAALVAGQTTAQGIGATTDSPYVSGAGSVIALLKSISTAATSGIPSLPVSHAPVSRSSGLLAGQSSAIFPAVTGRHYIAFQAPNSTAIWVNFLGGPASPSGADCVYFAAGTFYESVGFVPSGAITIYSPISVSLSAWEG